MKNALIKKLIIGVLLFFFAQNGFTQSIGRFVDKIIKVDSLNVPIDSQQYYFPNELIKPELSNSNKNFDSITIINSAFRVDLPAEWYSKHLFAMKEPLLFNRKTEKQIYRFTWLRTFNKPMTFRIEKWKNRYILYWKVLDGTGGYAPGKLEIEKLKVLTEKEWSTFINLIEKANFWNMKLGREIAGTDGSELIMEGVNSNNYRVVRVWSPNKGNFYDACDYLISLTDLNISEKKKY